MAQDGTRATAHLFRHEEPEAPRDFPERRLGAPPDPPRLNLSPLIDTPLSLALLDRLRRDRPREFEAWKMAG